MLAEGEGEESGAEVRRIDQDNINRFARLNARLREVRAERTELTKELEHLDDASTELMVNDTGGEKVLLLYGETFFETSEEEATEHCESRVDAVQAKIDALDGEQAAILEEQADLKKTLYGRFGKSINLEDPDDGDK